MKPAWLRRLALLLLAGLAAAGAVARPVPARAHTAAPDTVTHDDAHRLEVAYTTLSSISGQVRNVFDSREVAEGLPDIDENLHAIRHSVEETGQVVDIKQLQMCQLMLVNMQEQLAEWRTALGGAHETLEGMQARLAGLAHPPLRAVAADAAAQAQALAHADSALQVRQQRIGGLLAKRFARTRQLQTQVAANYIQTLELQDEVGDQLRRFGRATIKAAFPPLWAARPIPPPPLDHDELDDERYKQEIIGYYFVHNWDNWAFMLLIGGVFYGWVSFNYRRVQQRTLELEEDFRYLRPGPLAVTGVVMFSLAPALELHPPPVYLALLQALLLVALTAVFARSWARPLFRYWLVLVAFVVVLTLTNASADGGLGARWGLLLLNVLAVGLGGLLLWRLRETMALLRFLIPITWLFIGLNLLAVVGNVFGRLSLAKLFSTAAIFGLTQGIGLAVFVELFTEAFHLQILGSRSGEGRAATFDFDQIEKHLLRLLTGVAALLWLLVFTSNLNVYTSLYAGFEQVLTAPHTLGSTGFTLGNIGLFFFILFRFGPTAALHRLLFWRGGRRCQRRDPAPGLVAGGVAAADGGGGLRAGYGCHGPAAQQNCHRVRGAQRGHWPGPAEHREQPGVGHYPDFRAAVSRRRLHRGGRQVGPGARHRHRSSKLASLTGSEIILPNGDLLSQHVINWTRTNDHIRVDLVLKLAPGNDLQTDLVTARSLIEQEVKASPYTMHSLPPEILLSSVNGQEYELKVLFWITNIRQEQLTKSEILAGIYRRFMAEGLHLS